MNINERNNITSLKNIVPDIEYTGTILNINDPLKMGRCKIRVNGIFDTLDEEFIPWAFHEGNTQFAGNNGYGNISIPKKDTVVKVKFLNGDVYTPIYTAALYLNEDAKKEINGSYEGAHLFFYDSDAELKGFYTKDKGLKFSLHGSNITFNENKSITIEHNGTTSIIELINDKINITTNNQISITSTNLVEITSQKTVLNGTQSTQLGPNPNMHAIGSEAFFLGLKAIATIIDAKNPQTPGQIVELVEQLEKLSTSKNVILTV